MSGQSIRHRFKSIAAERLTNFKVERMIVVDLSYGTYDHAFLKVSLNAISKGNIQENRNMQQPFTSDYLKALKIHGLVTKDEDRTIRLTPLGQSMQKYIANMNDFVGEARSRGFSDDHLYRCLKSADSINGKTAGHLEYLDLVKDKRLTGKGQSVFDYLETQEIAKWKRAGKPEHAPVTF